MKKKVEKIFWLENFYKNCENSELKTLKKRYCTKMASGVVLCISNIFFMQKYDKVLGRNLELVLNIGSEKIRNISFNSLVYFTQSFLFIFSWLRGNTKMCVLVRGVIQREI